MLRSSKIDARNVLASLALLVGGLLTVTSAAAAPPDSLALGFSSPPMEARVRAYWWWLNGNVTKEAITRDLTEMKAKGFGGALICDADGASQDGNDRVPHGPTFFTADWRELYRHTLREADRLGLEMSLNIQSGWNLGGPHVPVEDAAKKLVWSEALVTGPTNSGPRLPEPPHNAHWYRDLFVVAYRLSPLRVARPAPLKNWQEKAMLKTLHFSAPDTRPLLTDLPSSPGEEDTHSPDVVDLTKRLKPDGTLQWQVPAGDWALLRFGCTVGDHAKVSTSSEGWSGYALDVLDQAAFKHYWQAVVEPLIADAGPLAGTTLKYLHTDSWEVEAINWTPTLREEFRKRRGYDLLPFLPVIAGRIVNSREQSNRFLHDFRKTLGDLAVDNHYKPFAAWAHRRGLAIHPESGGPHAVPIDAQRSLGVSDVPMSEFWARSWKHRVGDSNRFFVKQPASAAHTYGRRLVAAEGFTTIGPHWQETLWDNLKPSFDHACAEGLNRLVWHAFVCSPAEMGLPGQQYFAGTHLNPNVTWWEKSAPFFTYLNRCQFMLQRGLPVADALYYYGDHVPNFAQLRASDPAKLGPGYDYDVITEEAVLKRLAVKKGRLILPDGASYRVLVLAEHAAISLPVLSKVQRLVDAGAMVVGSKPQSATGLSGYPKSDTEVARMAEALWNDKPGTGHVLTARTTLEALVGIGLKPDFEYDPKSTPAGLDWIHRRDGQTEIYFVANRTNQMVSTRATFRVSGLAPELWNAVTGDRRFLTTYRDSDGRTTLPINLPPYGSTFVVFRASAAMHPPSNRGYGHASGAGQELDGPWEVAFDPRWGGPASVKFESLMSWTERAEPGIKFYSGTATYRKTFDLAKPFIGKPLALDLGQVRELAEVRINGRPLGIVWTPPFRVDITNALKPTGNLLEVEVVNFWPNRIIGDASKTLDKRLTRTNVRKLTASTSLMPSGLFGPVKLLQRE